MTDFGTLRVERETITIETIGATKPDPEWRYTDHKGHEHFWSENRTPTLVEVEGTGWWCEACREQHIESWLKCRLCDEVIQPKVLPDPGPHYIPGPAHYYLNDNEIPEEEAKALIERMSEEHQ